MKNTRATSQLHSLNAEGEFIEKMRSGSITHLDAIYSKQTIELVGLHGATGVDMTALWAATHQDWRCPTCKRSKAEIVRLNKNHHLMCRLVDHHDHMTQLLKARFEELSSRLPKVVATPLAVKFAERSAPMVSAFDNIVICDDCNGAEGRAKFAIGADRWFSFSPRELEQIVIPNNNSPLDISTDIAQRIWDEGKSRFALRKKIVDRIASIAAADEHWFEDVSVTQQPQKIIQSAISFAKTHYDVTDVLRHLTTDERVKKSIDFSTWRMRSHISRVEVPTTGEIEHLAKVTAARQWASVPDDWNCTCCGRAKTEIIRRSGKGKWSFRLTYRSCADPTSPNKKLRMAICGDCGLVAERAGQEALHRAGFGSGKYCSILVELNEIAPVISPRPHARHRIRPKEAEDLVRAVFKRVKGKQVP